MTNKWQDSAEKEQAIVNVKGTPKTDSDGKISRRELHVFTTICELLKNKLRDAGKLGEEYVRAKVAKETSTARKIASEAAESAARREESEAETDLIRQQAAEKFIENVRQLSNLDPIQQALALAKIIEENPDIATQLDRIQNMLERLEQTRGALVELRGPESFTITRNTNSSNGSRE